MLLLAGACGGKTDGGDGTGTGASAGTGGSGALGGGGGAPSGGTGALGGGGTGAFGGGGTGAFGGGGTGAFGGGGTGAFGGGGATGWDAKIDATCSAISKLPCPLFDCYAELASSVKESISWGCEGVMAAILDCAVQYPMYCQNGEPQLAVECQKLANAFEQCMGANQCGSWGGSDGSCGVDCPSWGASCKPSSSGGLWCACNNGPATGKQFQVASTCNSQSWQDIAASYCN